jgi:hypothetical protein
LRTFARAEARHPFRIVNEPGRMKTMSQMSAPGRGRTMAARACLFTLAVQLIGGPAVRAQEWNLSAMTLMDGDCQMRLGAAAPAPCKGRLMWTEFRNGRSMLTFVRDPNSFSVSGVLRRRSGAAGFRQSVDTFRAFEKETLLASDEGLKGACEFSPGASANTPGAITCEARGGDGAYKFSFENIHNVERKTF